MTFKRIRPKMDDKLYPKALFEEDLQRIREMNISDELRIEKGEALAHLYYNQNKNWMIDHFAIVDYRENILKEE
jgi:hypothetical protein